MFNRRGLLLGVPAGLLALAVVGVGIVYFVFFPGSAPKTLALTSPSATSSVSPDTRAGSGAAGTWIVTSGSQAGYRVRETLAFVGAPSDAVGRTSSVHGTITLAKPSSSYLVSAAALTVDVNTLTSDRPMRDQRLHSIGLQSDQFPSARFVLGSPIALPASADTGQIFTASATGNLTIHGVTRTVTIPIQARLSGSQIQLAGSITFPFEQFGMTPPTIAGFVSVQDSATMEFAINFVHEAA